MIYVDTSALLKRYIREHNSDAFEAWLAANAPGAISRLTFVEVRSGLARRRREGNIDGRLERAALEEIRTDLQDGTLTAYACADSHFADAFHLVDRLPDVPLRTLDALHLAIALSYACDGIATADDVMRKAAEALDLRVDFFGN